MDETTASGTPERVDYTQTIHRSANGDITFSYQGRHLSSADLTWTACQHQHPTPFAARECARTTASQPGVEPREGVTPTVDESASQVVPSSRDGVRRSHSYGAVECVTGAETVAAEAFATGAGLGRVGIFVTRLNGSGVFATTASCAAGLAESWCSRTC